jgi:hypothetical protein
MSSWIQVLDDLELSEVQEVSVLEFCCEVSSMPYNRRTSRSLRDIIRQGKNPQKLLLITAVNLLFDNSCVGSANPQILPFYKHG